MKRIIERINGISIIIGSIIGGIIGFIIGISGII